MLGNDCILEGQVALLSQSCYKVANECKATCLNAKAPKAPIIKLSTINVPLSDADSDFFRKQMDACNKVLAFNQHSMFSMTQLVGLLRFCVMVSENLDVKEAGWRVSVSNKFIDRYEVCDYCIYEYGSRHIR